MSHCNATASAPVNGERAISIEQRQIALNATQAAMVEQLVEREAKRLGEAPERVRRIVEIAILARGIAAMQEDA